MSPARRAPPLRAKLALMCAAAIGALSVATQAATLLRARDLLLGTVDASLGDIAAQVAEDVVIVGGKINSIGQMSENGVGALFVAQGLGVRIADAAGATVFRYGLPLPEPWWPPAGAAPGPESRGGPGGGGSFRTRAYAFREEPGAAAAGQGKLVAGAGRPNVAAGFVQVAQSLEAYEATMSGLLLLGLGLGAAALAAAAGGAFLMARSVLRPVDALTAKALEINAGKLDLRIPETGVDDEVGRMVAAFNLMLDRIALSFERERRFIADAAHDLLTPITTLRTIIATSGPAGRAPAEVAEAWADLEHESGRLKALAEHLLADARADAGAIRRDRVDLSQLLRDVAAAFEAECARRGLALAAEVPEGLGAVGDRDALARVFMNVLSNAVRYTETGSVRLVAGPAAGGVLVRVADTGVGIAADKLPHVFERFYRGDPARGGSGHGLGLSIVARLLALHGGKAEVASAPGEGTEVSIFLPAEGPPAG